MQQALGPSATGLLLLAAATGWWASRRLPHAPNVDVLRRRARLALVAGMVAVLAGTAHVAAAALGAAGSTAGSTASAPDGWTVAARLALVVLPLAVLWAVTLPRTWVLVRRQRMLDPLRWPGRETRADASAPVLVVPFVAATVGAITAWLLPSVGGAVGVALAGAAVAAAVLVGVLGRPSRVPAGARSWSAR